MTHSNGIAREFDYHNLLGDKRLQKITNRTGTAASDIVSTFDYIYNAVGNIKDWGVRNNQGARNTWTLDYNPADELTDALLKSSSSAVIEDLGWRFDRAGNRRLARDGSTWTGYGVNEVNELTEISDGNAHAPISGQFDEPAFVTVQGVRANVKPAGGGNYQFEAPLNVEPDSSGEFTVRADEARQRVDGKPEVCPQGCLERLPPRQRKQQDASGNVVESTFAAPAGSVSTPRSFVYDDNGNLTNDGVRVYVYDAANRLIGIDHTDGSTTDIEYDAFSRRDRIIETDATATVTSDKRYVWNGLTLLEERDTATDAVLRRFYGQGETRLTGADAGSYFYVKDHLGSIREVVDNAGTIRARYNYSLWGERTQTIGSVALKFGTEFGYTGHWYHDSSGLHLAPFRAYNAEIGRWLNRDPIAENGGINLYAYAGNDPVNHLDALGLSPGAALNFASDSYRGLVVSMGDFDGAGAALNKASNIINKQDNMAKELLKRNKKPGLMKRSLDFCKRNARSLKKWFSSTGAGIRPKPPNPVDELLSERGAEAQRGLMELRNRGLRERQELIADPDSERAWQSYERATE